MTSTTTAEQIAEHFDVEAVDHSVEVRMPSYNVAPTQPLMVVVEHEGTRRLAEMHWGLVPSFFKDRTSAARMINARAETVATKPAFRAALQRRRAIVPATGFFEWQATSSHQQGRGQDRGKQPWYFAPRTAPLLAFAALWEVWRDPDLADGASRHISCSIVTTEANADMREVHHRMPLVLTKEDWACWLARDITGPERLTPLLQTPRAGLLDAWTVAPDVGSTRNEGPHLIDRYEPSPTTLFG